VSRRSDRAREAKAAREAARAGAAPREARGAGREGAAAGREAGGAEREAARAGGWSLGVQLLFLLVVFAVTTGVAELAGAANLGVALGIGQVAFALAVVYLLVRR